MDRILVQEDPCRIWLGGLPTKVTEFAVLQLAKQFGPLEDFQFPVHRAGHLYGSTLGYCFVKYKLIDDAKKALKRLVWFCFLMKIIIFT